jgi:hypothetical protein
MFLSIILIVEVWDYMLNKNLTRAVIDTKLSKQVTRKVNISELENEKKTRKFVLFENYLIDVANFMGQHPGGKNVIEENLYQDVGRYLTGTQAFNSTFPAHTHKFSTMKHIIKHLTYAELVELEHRIVVNSDILDKNLRINEKTDIAEGIYEFRFYNDILSFSRFLTGHEWMGRHFAVSNENLNKTRYYSLCLSLDINIRSKLNGLLDNALEETMITSNVRLDMKDRTSYYLNLYAKRYNYPDALSNSLYKGEDTFHIKGPLGVGLGLKGTLRGTHVIFCAGTGIFPFIDLIAYTMRYTVDKVNNRNPNLDKNYMVDESFDIADDFKLVLFASFPTQKGSIFTDECNKLKKLCEKYDLNTFEYILRISSLTKERWNSNYIYDKLFKYVNNIEKVYLVGPIQFMDDIKGSLSQKDLDLGPKVFMV